MTSSQREFLTLFGWDNFFESQNTETLTGLIPARVNGEERGLYRVQFELEKVCLASVTGKIQAAAKGRADFPAVGDWVMIELSRQSGRAIIHSICPRKTLIQRKRVGESSDIQILSTNVDFVFVATSADDDLNFARVERYLAMIKEAGCIPIILLTKADKMAAKVSDTIGALKAHFTGVEVHPLSKDDFENAEFFTEYLKIGKTGIVVGSSGVGKSTLVNFLTGKNEIKTQEVQTGEGKGKHTTTSRSLYVTRYGGLIIDTPGMRELQLADHADGVSEQFSDIEQLIASCRFSDCQHRAEPGCKVLEAFKNESLPENRWKSYLKLASEIRSGLIRKDKALASQEKKTWKKATAQSKQKKNEWK